MILLPPIMKKSGFSPFVEIWSSNGTSTVPGNNPQWATIVCWGGGDSGQKGDSSPPTPGQGGGGGQFCISSVNVVGISQLNIVVGRGGSVPFFDLTTNNGGNTVVRYTNSTGTIVARADRNGGTTTVRTDYANIVNFFIDREASGGAQGTGSSGIGGGGGAPGSDGGNGTAGLSGDSTSAAILADEMQPNDTAYTQGKIHPSAEFFPPPAYANNRTSLPGYGGYGGDDSTGTVDAPGSEFDGMVLSVNDAMSGQNGAVIIFWGDPSYWDSQNWRTNDTDAFFE